MHLQSENSNGALEFYFSYSAFPSNKHLLSPVSSTKARTGLTCWFIDFDSKLGWNGQFKEKKKYQTSFSIFHHEIWVFGTIESMKYFFLSLAAEVVMFWCSQSLRCCPTWWQCFTSLLERGSQQSRALLSFCSSIYSRSSRDKLKNVSARLKTCLHYSMCCVNVGLCLPRMDEFFLAVPFNCITSCGNKALQCRTVFGDYI